MVESHAIRHGAGHPASLPQEADIALPAPDAPASRVFTSQRLRLHYLDWGNEAAPPLILLHGALDHAHSWDWAARELRRDWHVIAPDLRGHGDSDWSPDGVYGMPYLACDLAELVHQLGDPRPLTIVGHSLGGAIAVHYTALYPARARRLVAIEGLGPAPPLMAEQAARPAADRWIEWIEGQRALSARAPRFYASEADALARMRAQNPNLSDEQARHLTVHGLRRGEDGRYAWKYDNLARSQAPVSLAEADLHAFWARITCPVMLCWGRDSWASNPAEDGRAAVFRNARVAIYEQAGHWLHHDRFDRFMADLRGFLGEDEA